MKVHHAKENAVVDRSNSFSRFLCFKPLDPLKTENVFFYLPANRQSDSEMDTFFPDKESEISSRDENVSKRRRFIRAVRAVLFHIKLRSRNRESRIGRDFRSCSFRFRKRNHVFDSAKSASMRSTSSSMISSSSSSRSSFQTSEPSTSLSWSSNPNPSSLKEHGSLEKQANLRKQSSGSIIIGFSLILISLALTIFWGRLLAIAFNAIWLASIPQSWVLRWSRVGPGSEDVDKIESVREQRRRRVIMEGLLDRRHYHQHNHHRQKL